MKHLLSKEFLEGCAIFLPQSSKEFHSKSKGGQSFGSVLLLTIRLSVPSNTFTEPASAYTHHAGFGEDLDPAGTYSPGHLNGGGGENDWILELNHHFTKFSLHLPVIHPLPGGTHICQSKSVVNQ